jgi:hypothetical protein
VQARFVPDFKTPALHLFVAVAILKTLHQIPDQIGPFLIGFWWGDVAVLPEEGVVTAGEIFGYAGKFHEGFDTDAQQEIVELINVSPVMAGMAVRVLTANYHVIGQQTLRTILFETAFVAGFAQLILPVGEQPFIGSSGADAFVEGRVERALYHVYICCVDSLGMRALGLEKSSAAAGSARAAQAPAVTATKRRIGDGVC